MIWKQNIFGYLGTVYEALKIILVNRLIKRNEE